jgi:uncharacterized membrane protein
MKSIQNYQKLLLEGISITEIIAYSISFIIILLSIIKTIIEFVIYVIEYRNTNTTMLFKKTRFQLTRASALALTFILTVEILKLIYIKSYKQLVIVTSLVIIKLLINYFLIKEIYEDEQNRKFYT